MIGTKSKSNEIIYNDISVQFKKDGVGPLAFDEKIKSFTIVSIFNSSETDLWCPQNTINVKNSKGEQNFRNLLTYI